MLVNEFLQNNACRFPDKEALVYDGKRLTYHEIVLLSNQLALALSPGNRTRRPCGNLSDE